MTIAQNARVEAHPHRPKVLKFREGGDDRCISARVIPHGHVQYVSLLMLKDAEFKVQPAGQARAHREGQRNVHAFVRGTVALCLDDEGDSQHFREEWIRGYEWVLVSYNPFKADHFYEVLPQPDGSHEAGRQVLAAEAVVMRGGDLYAINPTFA